MQIDYESYTLKNGIRVLFIPTDLVNSISVSAYYKFGAALENDENQGITHFLEHVSMTATKKWPDKNALSKMTEFSGGSPNAETGHETLHYYITLPYHKADLALEYIFQTITQCTFNSQYIEQERTIILDEISKSEDNVNVQATEFARKALSVKKSGYQRSVAGTADVVSRITAKELKKHRELAHNPKNLVLIISGKFSPSNVKKYVSNTFAKMPETAKCAVFPKDSIAAQKISVEHSPKTDLILTGVVFPYHGGKDISALQDITLSVVHNILCGPLSSRLLQRLREKEGLLYSIFSDTNSYEHFGDTSIRFRILPQLFEKTTDILFDELVRFVEKGITKTELHHYIEFMTNRKLVRYDTFYDYAGLIRSPFIWEKEILTLDQVLVHLQSLTVAEINENIRTMFPLQNTNVVAYGNVDKKIVSLIEKLEKKHHLR